MAENMAVSVLLVMAQLPDQPGIGAKCRRIGIHVCAVKPFLASFGCLAGSATHHRAPDIVFKFGRACRIIQRTRYVEHAPHQIEVAGYPSPNAHDSSLRMFVIGVNDALHGDHLH
ncbi:MAG: hypothetical protein KDJ67_04125 [Nitratireductor sp.]|nr:hypothetical protein [Nitratireductor sp.]